MASSTQQAHAAPAAITVTSACEQDCVQGCGRVVAGMLQTVCIQHMASSAQQAHAVNLTVSSQQPPLAALPVSNAGEQTCPPFSRLEETPAGAAGSLTKDAVALPVPHPWRVASR
eukprot:scaffold118097_cov19-Tisochrysis_lutea.AAC.1